jgi:hypothetical protein
VRVARRAAGVGLGVTSVAAGVLFVEGYRWDAAVLTLTAVVGIINTLWLEGVLLRVLQPERPRFTRGAAAFFVGRLALWGLLFLVLFAIRDRFSMWAVAGGIACFLVGLGVVGASLSATSPGEE